MVKIPNITISDNTGFFAGKCFDWASIASFSIITGINGSGKTKLLEHIADSAHFNGTLVIRYIDVAYKPPAQKHANEIAGSYSHSLFIEDGKYYAVEKDSRRTDWTGAISNFKANNVLNNLDYAIIDTVISERKKFQSDTAKIREELGRLDKYKTDFNKNNLLPVDKNNDQPWDRIDRILDAFGLLIRVDRMNLNAGLEFLRYNQGASAETTLEMKHLSSGEKVAFALALWTWGNSKGHKTDVLLVDEFDAHLNPSIAKKFIDIINEYFVGLGVQVIMTTHNPSTVAFAKDAGAGIIWMADGAVDLEMRYEDIIRELSNGLIDINYLTDETQLLIDNRERCVIYTEGKTDKIHLSNAIEALSRQEDFNNYFIFGCTGADTVPFFIKLQTGQQKRIALLDSDEKGKAVYQRIINNAELKAKVDDKSLDIIFVSPEDDKVIEDLFCEALRVVKKKEKFATLMSQPAKKTAQNYAGFTSLLNQLLELSAAKHVA